MIMKFQVNIFKRFFRPSRVLLQANGNIHLGLRRRRSHVHLHLYSSRQWRGCEPPKRSLRGVPSVVERGAPSLYRQGWEAPVSVALLLRAAAAPSLPFAAALPLLRPCLCFGPAFASALSSTSLQTPLRCHFDRSFAWLRHPLSLCFALVLHCVLSFLFLWSTASPLCSKSFPHETTEKYENTTTIR